MSSAFEVVIEVALIVFPEIGSPEPPNPNAVKIVVKPIEQDQELGELKENVGVKPKGTPRSRPILPRTVKK